MQKISNNYIIYIEFKLKMTKNMHKGSFEIKDLRREKSYTPVRQISNHSYPIVY